NRLRRSRGLCPGRLRRKTEGLWRAAWSAAPLHTVRERPSRPSEKVDPRDESGSSRHPCTRARAINRGSWWRGLDLTQRPPGNEPGEHSRLLYPASTRRLRASRVRLCAVTCREPYFHCTLVLYQDLGPVSNGFHM